MVEIVQVLESVVQESVVEIVQVVLPVVQESVVQVVEILPVPLRLVLIHHPMPK